MDLPARVPGEPAFDPRMLVGRIVVHDQMNIQRRRNVLLHASQESEVPLVTMTGLALGQNVPGRYVQRLQTGWWSHGVGGRA